MGAYVPITQVSMVMLPVRESRWYDMIDHDNMYWFIYTASHDEFVQDVLPKRPPATLIQKAWRSHLARACVERAKRAHRRLALCMGLHERLGQESLLLSLGPDLLALSESFV